MGVALVTGASAGIGLELAKIFAREGHDLILVARRKEQLEELSHSLKKQYPKINTYVLTSDLGIPDAGTALFQQVQQLGLEVDFLVNNAGFGSNGKFFKLPLNKELQMMDLNMRVLVELTHLFLPSMIKRKSGRILNVGSTAAFQPGPLMATYYATKAFVNSFSLALNEELRDTDVTCTVLAPGATATEFAQVASMQKSRLFNLAKAASSADVAQVGYRAMMRGRPLVIQGVANNILRQLVRLTPDFLILKIAGFLNR